MRSFMKPSRVLYRALGIASFSLSILGLWLSQVPSSVEAQQNSIPKRINRNQRIVGGTTAPDGAYPWFVALEDSTGFQFCGGTLIAVNKVLTAAHCTNVVASNELRIRVGSNARRIDRTGKGSGGTVFRVKEQKRHPRFRDLGSSFDYDVAVWTLRSSVTLSNTVGLIALPSRCGQVGSVDLTCPSGLAAPGTVLRTIGLGDTTDGGSPSTTLIQVDLPVISNNLCNRRVSYNGRVSKRMICAGQAAGGVDSCQGDSGGPIFGNYSSSNKTALQAGIVSWGDGCAIPNKYGVYTRLSHPEIVDFITKRLSI
jgi:trypsin